MSHHTERFLRVGSRRLRTTAAFDLYWRFAAERQRVFWRRLSGATHDLTADPLIRSYRFTNAYRATDRVSQFLINEILIGAGQPRDELFRTLAFKIFNRIETWEYLVHRLGTDIGTDSFDTETWACLLDERQRSGRPIYSNAYIMPPPDLGAQSKHRNHLKLLEIVREGDTLHRLLRADSLRNVFEILRQLPGLGPFLAFQYAIDLNYGSSLNFQESDFVVAGPGARRGAAKCFVDRDGLTVEETIRALAEIQEDEFDQRGLKFWALPSRPLQLIDCQNLLCEIDKYTRGLGSRANPDTAGRTRIKQRYRPDPTPLTLQLPTKWNISQAALEGVRLRAERESPIRIATFPKVHPAVGTDGIGGVVRASGRE